jgi:hypothetical protein
MNFAEYNFVPVEMEIGGGCLYQILRTIDARLHTVSGLEVLLVTVADLEGGIHNFTSEQLDYGPCTFVWSLRLIGIGSNNGLYKHDNDSAGFIGKAGKFLSSWVTVSFSIKHLKFCMSNRETEELRRRTKPTLSVAGFYGDEW